MNYSLWFWILNAGSALLRLLVIGRIGLSGDEAHYWTYTRYLSFSYFDHPALIAWLIKPFDMLLGSTELAVRLPAVLLFFFTSFFVYRLAKALFGERTAFWSVVLLNVTPVFSFLGAVMAVPDAPLAFFWIVFVYLFWRTMQDGNASRWYLMGLVFGLGLLSKYNAVLLAPSALLFLLASPKNRSWLRRKEPYLAFLVAFVVFLPAVIWNLENGWASFGFQLRHGLGHVAPHFSLALLGRCLGAQAGYISPILFFLYWIVLALLVKRGLGDRDERFLLLCAFSLPTLVLFNGIASFNEILPHWPAMGYLVLSIAVAQRTVELWNRRWFAAVTWAGWGLALALTLLVPLQAMYKLIPPEIFLSKAEASKIEDGITRAEKVDITNELYGWREAGAVIAEIIKNAPEPKPFVFTHRHYVASQLSFYIPGHPRVYCLSDRIDAYDFWQRDLSGLEGRDGIFVTNDYFYVRPQGMYPFASWQELPPIDIVRNGRKARVFWITVGRGFGGNRLDPVYTSAAAGSWEDAASVIERIDHRVFWFFNHSLHFPAMDHFMAFLTRFDNSVGVNSGLLFLLGLVAVILWTTRRAQFWPEFLLVIGIVAVGGILVHFLKDLFDRLRPLSVFGGQVITFHEHLYKSSFPSGHTQIAFSVATFLASRYRRYWWLFFGLAAFMGLSRIYVGSHFPLDVVGGAVTGIVVARVMMKLID